MFLKIFRRSLMGYCPQCGDGILFIKWAKMKKKCTECKFHFIESNGDNWFFLLFIDRGLFIFPIIVAYYFGMEPKSLIVLSIGLLIIFIVATPLRLSICLAVECCFKAKFRRN